MKITRLYDLSKTDLKEIIMKYIIDINGKVDKSAYINMKLITTGTESERIDIDMCRRDGTDATVFVQIEYEE